MRAELARVERLRQVIVGAHFEAENPILLVAARRQHQHRRARARAELAEHLETPDVGEHHVEHDERVVARQRAFDAFNAAVHRLDVIAFRNEVSDSS